MNPLTRSLSLPLALALAVCAPAQAAPVAAKALRPAPVSGAAGASAGAARPLRLDAPPTIPSLRPGVQLLPSASAGLSSVVPGSTLSPESVEPRLPLGGEGVLLGGKGVQQGGHAPLFNPINPKRALRPPPGGGRPRSGSAFPKETQSEKKQHSLLSGLRRVLRGNRAAAAFDGGRAGFLPEQRQYPEGVELDDAPAPPPAPVSWHDVRRPGLQPPLIGTQPDGALLPGAPRDAAGVEAALRDYIRANPARFGGLAPEALETAIARKVEGREGLDDMVYVSFRQVVGGLPVHGAGLSFQVKLSGDSSAVVSATARLYPSVPVDAAGALSAPELLDRAAARLGPVAGAREQIIDAGRRVLHLGGRWRAAQIFESARTGLAAAVDVATGEAFLWDDRLTAARTEIEAEEASGVQISGRGVADGPHAPQTELSLLPLGHTEIRAGGRTFFADAEGRFRVPGEGDAPVRLEIRLAGRYAKVNNQAGENLAVVLEARPGELVQAVFNPEGEAEEAVAQVNAYFFTTRLRDWLAERGVEAESMNRPVEANVNIDDECNAYYTRWGKNINFFTSSGRCVNTAYGDVILHEGGHAFDDALGGILNSGLSEGWGDVLTNFMTGQPVVGRGFMKSGERPYIRHAENTYQYRRNDEVHKQGQAWMGFAWKLRQALIASLKASGLSDGEALRRGAALAEHLVAPVLLANVRDIPGAIEAVLLRDMNKDGRAPHLQEIQAAARAHGITVTEAGVREGLPGWAARLVSWALQRLGLA